MKVTLEELKELITSGADVTTVDVSGIDDMYELFYANNDFNQDISGWDVSNVLNMKNMFRYARKFDQDLSGWNFHPDIKRAFMFSESGHPSVTHPTDPHTDARIFKMGELYCKQCFVGTRDEYVARLKDEYGENTLAYRNYIDILNRLDRYYSIQMMKGRS